MRLDKYLKVSRIIKRRTIANDACDAGRILVNGKTARASYAVKVGDIITVNLGSTSHEYKVLSIAETVKKEEADRLYELIQ
ncbi:MAG: RNA-binding S4 domain-containing protein [Clostridia bacterium]|nr:RNA-binding S4 domain-containing protein [Clostridia bacterium]